MSDWQMEKAYEHDPLQSIEFERKKAWLDEPLNREEAMSYKKHIDLNLFSTNPYLQDKKDS